MLIYINILNDYLSEVGEHSPAAPWQHHPGRATWVWCPKGARQWAEEEPGKEQSGVINGME